MVPCHRAMRSDRSLGGYQGGLAMERALPQREAIGFDSLGRVLTRALTWRRVDSEDLRNNRGWEAMKAGLPDIPVIGTATEPEAGGCRR